VGGRTARRPVLVFDGDCAFCTSCARLLKRIGPETDVVAWQVADLDELGITAAQAAEALRWLAAAGYRLVARNRHRLPGGTPACASTRQPRSPPN
jgi:predicted DCC family thiol-disulfide oxidoreductase YuxK